MKLTNFKKCECIFVITLFIISSFAMFGPNNTGTKSNTKANDTNSLAENALSKVDSTYSAVVSIDGNAALATYANPATDPLGSYYGGGGSGTAQDPYIIQNYWATIYNTQEDGISIADTTAYFVLRNCTINAPYPWGPVGFRFTNVQNGILESSAVYGAASSIMLNSIYPTSTGVLIAQSSHIIIENFYANTFASGQTTIFPLYKGIEVDSSQNITITNSTIMGNNALVVSNSADITIENNLIMGPDSYLINGKLYGSQNYVNIYHGIVLANTLDSYIYNNKIFFWLYAGILLQSSSDNLILENYIDLSTGGVLGLNPQTIEEIGTSSNNQYSRINSPVNNTNFVQSNPDPGYYPGGISAYYSGEGFDNLPNGPISSLPLSNIATISDYWLYPSYMGDSYHQINIISNKTDSMGYNHKKVLSISKLVGDSQDSSITNEMVPDQESYYNKISGTIEFWLLVDGTGSTTVTILNVGAITAIQFQISNQQFKIWDGSTYNPISGLSFENDVWYRISMNVSADGTYGAISKPYQYNLEIYDSFDSNPLYTSQNLNFINNGNISRLQFSAQGSTNTQENAYVDAIGYSWSALTRSQINSIEGFNGTSYQVGDNKQEGLVFDYNVQRNNPNGMQSAGGYNVNIGYVISQPDGTFNYNSIYAIEGIEPIYRPTITPVEPSANFNVFSYRSEYQNWTFVVPLPKDGDYKIQIVISNTSTGSWVQSHTWYSYPIEFSKYFDRGIQIINHDENNVAYPPGTILNPAENLTVTETIRSFNWYNQSTKATVYYSYKINDGPWLGPNLIGSGTGEFNINFTIDNGNYSNFDTVYYYLTYDQFNSTNYPIGTYYLKNDLSLTHIEAEAQQSDFIKKIAPIAFNLSLGYNVYYQSQLAMQVGSTTYTPIMDIMDEYFSMNFNNLTSTLSEYNVTSSEYLLDHLLNSVTNNIANSTVSGPPFSYAEKINSPFIITTNMIQGFENGTYSTLTIPYISFDYIHPGLNVSFTGGTVTLTYQGIDHWPDSPSNPNQIMLNFTDPTHNIILRYDSTTGIMTYFEWLNDTVPLQTQKIVFALTSNNAYPINLQIEQREQIITTGTAIIPQHLFAIIYDPPGDHSYGQITSGTTMTYSVDMSQSTPTTTSTCLAGPSWLCGIGNFVGVSDTQTNTTINTESNGNSISITFGTTLTSSQDTEHANLMDHGGDLYVGSGIIVSYYIMQEISYIVVNKPDPPNEQIDDIRLFNGTPFINYNMAFNTQFEVLGAYLDQFGLASLRQSNIFLNNSISLSNQKYVQEIPNSPLLFTPTSTTEIYYSSTSTTSVSYSMNIHTTTNEAFSFNSPATSILSKVGKSVPDAGPAISGLFSGLQNLPGIGLGVPTDLTFNTVSTTATTTNRQIMAHLEDDDGTPIGQNDQFEVHIYQDLRYNTFGYIVVKSDSYSSYPYETNTLDRRPPTLSEISSTQQFVHGTAQLQAAGFDEETNVSYIKIYYSRDPYFGIGATIITIINGSDPIALNSIYYNFNWNTNGLEGTYYLYADTYDNAVPVKNHLLSNPYEIVIDNTPPSEAQALVTQPYAGIYYLFAKASDNGTGIAYVQYWDGVPNNPSSSIIGTSSDSSSGYNVVWVINPNGSDSGVHIIYARAYDRAGNYLDSSPVLVNVGSGSTTNQKTITQNNTQTITQTNTQTITKSMSSSSSTTSSKTNASSLPDMLVFAIFLVPVSFLIRKRRKRQD